jgi:hypothetical protein
VARSVGSITKHLIYQDQSKNKIKSVGGVDAFHRIKTVCCRHYKEDQTTYRERNSTQAGEAFTGIGGGTFVVATWNRAAILFVNSGQGAFPVAARNGKDKNNKNKKL